MNRQTNHEQNLNQCVVNDVLIRKLIDSNGGNSDAIFMAVSMLIYGNSKDKDFNFGQPDIRIVNPDPVMVLHVKVCKFGNEATIMEAKILVTKLEAINNVVNMGHCFPIARLKVARFWPEITEEIKPGLCSKNIEIVSAENDRVKLCHRKRDMQSVYGKENSRPGSMNKGSTLTDIGTLYGV
ncbi:19919_t:CDS:2 [Racocetra fulgida]|uniref:19919_t:CDS:1 n=1 Tax=Racocetra fulgida TaxID=60492 RepID=A0A9N9GB78_9GLOM|nr:19919_t:CDS:2 [Racocetra fulgida]